MNNASSKPRDLKSSGEIADAFEILMYSTIITFEGVEVPDGMHCGVGFKINNIEQMMHRGPALALIRLYRDASRVLKPHTMGSFVEDTLDTIVEMTTTAEPRVTPSAACHDVFVATKTRLVTMMAIASTTDAPRVLSAANTPTKEKGGANANLERKFQEQARELKDLKRRATTAPGGQGGGGGGGGGAAPAKGGKTGFLEGSEGPGGFKRLKAGNPANPVGCRDPRCKGPCGFNHTGK